MNCRDGPDNSKERAQALSREIEEAEVPPGIVSARSCHAQWSWIRPALLMLGGVALIYFSACTRGPGQVRPIGQTGDITRTELDEGPFTSAHHAIERLRPSWLRRRGARTLSNPDPRPVVWLDGVRLGRIEELLSIKAETVETISLLSPTDATTRFGTGHASGALVVITRRVLRENQANSSHSSRRGASALVEEHPLRHLAIMKASERWSRPVQDWTSALNHLSIVFEGRIPV